MKGTLAAFTSPASKRVLLVEDDLSTLELMRQTLQRAGYMVEVATGVQQGLAALHCDPSIEFLALLLDYKLPDGEPWALADAARARVPEVPVIFVTGMSNEDLAIEALHRGFADYVKKTSGFWNELPAVLERLARLSLIKSQMYETNAMMSAIVEHSSDLVAVCKGEGELVYVSPAGLNLLGREPEELLTRSWTELVIPEDRDALLSLLAGAGQNPAQNAILRCCRKDGSLAWMEASIALLKGASPAQPIIVLTLHDVTEQREHVHQMESSLKEKEVLLGEIHHRVKNNLQVVQSLLRMSVRPLPQGKARAAAESTIQRVHAMALVHERLYHTKDVASLSLSDYLRDLFNGVEASNSVPHGQIQLRLDTEEIPLTLDYAIPFGLLANELISNCFKHGFPNGYRGTVDFSIHRVEGVVHMVVSDDGAGLPEHFDAAGGPSMGLKLAESLAHQLGGTLCFTNGNGCRVEADLARL
jgi:two-component system response regulator